MAEWLKTAELDEGRVLAMTREAWPGSNVPEFAVRECPKRPDGHPALAPDPDGPTRFNGTRGECADYMRRQGRG